MIFLDSRSFAQLQNQATGGVVSTSISMLKFRSRGLSTPSDPTRRHGLAASDLGRRRGRRDTDRRRSGPCSCPIRREAPCHMPPALPPHQRTRLASLARSRRIEPWTAPKPWLSCRSPDRGLNEDDCLSTLRITGVSRAFRVPSPDPDPHHCPWERFAPRQSFLV